MPITADQLGPGTLSLGAGPLDVSLQVTACKLTTSENVTTTDAVKVLGGDSLPGTSSVSFTQVLSGTFLQDLSAAGVVQWSHDNAGEPQAFTFIPNTARGRQVSGFLSPVPLDVGGDEVEGAHMRSEFSWRITGADLAEDGERIIPEAVV